MAESIRKVGETYCTTTNIGDTSCRGDHCHNTTSYIHTCVTYPTVDNCENITSHFVICNSTGTCRNTTRDIIACYDNFNDYCVNAHIITHCCTNGVCRNRTTDSTCSGSMNQSYKQVATSVCASDDHVCNPFFPFDPTACINRITAGFHRRLGISK